MNHGGFSPHANMEVDKLPIQASRKKYGVFLSFRGEDTRRTFTSHLQKTLKEKGIETFIDDEKLQRGDEISKALLDAIENSTISVIIFSENYASSSWCLDELVHILRCKQNNKQTVLPVFYQVDPSDVRKQGGSYADAFVKLEERFKDKIINKWRAALTAAANLSGYDSSESRTESELVESIVKDIMGKLDSTYSPSIDYTKGLVGIDKSIADLKSMLFSNPSHARIVGIWGMGGLGKTTLANAIFQQFRPHFQGHCFLANVREEMQKQGENYLKKLCFGALSKEKDPDLANLQLVKERLCRKKLLIVLDDVDDSDQYDRLIGDWDWLNSESRVIITSRDREVLRNIIGDDSNEVIYDLKELEEKEALQLFCLHAFKGNSAVEISYKEMSIKFVNYAGGVPLALKVLGSHLFKKSKEVWDSAWNKLRVVPNDKIQGALEISFAGLGRKEKDIFLDIACFFKGRGKNFVTEILDESGYFEDVITALIDKSLITLSYNRLQMHDLLQQMGWEIARGQCHKEVGNYSRLWKRDDIYHVLKNNIGTAKIEGIFLNRANAIKEEMNLDPFVFTKMPSLRLLQIEYDYGFHQMDDYGFKMHLPQGLHSFPDKLRYLRWDSYPLESLGSHFTPHNLVCLDMSNSQLEKLWNEFQHDLGNLKYVYLSGSKKLTCLPDLSRAKLRVLDLKDCKSLVELPPLRFQDGFYKLTKEETEELYHHVYHDVFWVSELFYDGIKSQRNTTLSSSSLIETVYRLDLRGCYNLKTLSGMSGNINHICLRLTSIEELHSSIGSLNNLVFIDLRDCKLLKNLPSSFCDLRSLEYLDMSGCLSIDKFPKLPKNIRGLDLSETSIEQVLSSSFECLPCLEILYMTNCKKLESLPTNICKLMSLKRLSLLDCSQFKSCPEIVEPMVNLELLKLSGTGIKEIPSSIVNLVGLQFLMLSCCKNLEYVPTNIYDMCKLNYLKVDGCPKLQNFPHYCLSSLDPTKTTIAEVPFCISQMLRESKCSGSCAGKIQSFFLQRRDGSKFDDNVLKYYFYMFGMHFSCCECMIFYIVQHILMTQYFRNNVVHMEITSLHFLSGRIQESSDPGYFFCHSGKKIPQWFTHQSMGTSININFSPLQHNTKVVGFALCIVIDCDQCFSDPGDLDIDCEYKDLYFSQKFCWTLQRRHDAHFDDDSNSENNLLDWSSGLVFIWYLSNDDLYDYYYAKGASFEFYLRQSTTAFGIDRVQQCGIRVLYR